MKIYGQYSCVGCLKNAKKRIGEQASLGGTDLIITLNYEENLRNLNFFYYSKIGPSRNVLIINIYIYIYILKNPWSVKKCKIPAFIFSLYDYSKYPIKSICEQASFLDILGQKSIFWQKSLKTDKQPMLGRSNDPYKQIQQGTQMCFWEV